MKRIQLTSPEYGLTFGIDRALRQLAQDGLLSAIGCVVVSDLWSREYLPLRDTVDAVRHHTRVGLTLTLTGRARPPVRARARALRRTTASPALVALAGLASTCARRGACGGGRRAVHLFRGILPAPGRVPACRGRPPCLPAHRARRAQADRLAPGASGNRFPLRGKAAPFDPGEQRSALSGWHGRTA